MVAERRFDRRANVRIGRRIDANVLIDRDGIPDSLEVLRLLDGRYHVVLPADPTARLTLRGSPIANVTVRDGAQQLVPVEQAAGGSLQIGDLVVMFQLVPVAADSIAVYEHTILRVGLVFDGRLISDQMFDDRKHVCIGRGRRDRIVLDNDYDGPSLCFRRHKDGSATLIGDDRVDLRIGLPNRAPADVNSLQSAGFAVRHGSRVEVHLASGARGRAQLGPYTVLFQVLVRRTHVPRLPRRGLVGQLVQSVVQDPVWSMSLALAAVLVCGVLGQAMLFQRQVGRFQTAARAQPEQHAQIWEVALPEPEPVVAPVIAPLKPAAVAPVAVTKPKPTKNAHPAYKRVAKARPSSGDRAADLDDHTRIVRRVAKTTIAGVFTGARSKLIALSPDGDAELMARAVGAAGFGSGAEPGATGLKLRGAVGRPTVEAVKVKHAKIERRGRIAGLNDAPAKREARVKIHVGLTRSTGDQGPVKRVGRVIGRKASAVRRCYDRALRKDASISAKIRVSFTVGTAGTITNVVISGVSGDLAACIKAVFLRARGLPILPMSRVFRQSFVLTAGS